MKLTVNRVKSLAKAGVPGMAGDGRGLYLQVSKAGGVSWIFRYKIEGKSRYMGLGAFPTVDLAKARCLADDARKVLSNGLDPLDAREVEKEEKRKLATVLEAKKVTFMSAAAEYREAHGSAWSEKWHKGWWRKLELYAFPLIGSLPVGEIETTQVLKVLQPIWGSKTRTADEVRGQIEQVLDAAKARGIREGENPARWRGHLSNLLSKTEKKKARKRQHYAAMHWLLVPSLISELWGMRTRDSVAALLLILTGARSHMVRYATWNEFDLSAGVWLLPASRMKMREAFQIPISLEVVQLVKSIPRVENSPYLFSGQGKTGVIHANAVRNLLHGLGYDTITRHGFRSSFRDWAGECTNFPRDLCELALAHDERTETESAYSRSDFFNKRRKLMNAWAKFALGEVSAAKRAL